MSRNFECYGKRAATQNLHTVVFRNETGVDQRFQINRLQRFLLGQAFEQFKVHALVFDTFEVCKTVLGQTSLQRHLTSFKSNLRSITRTRLGTFTTARAGSAISRALTATDATFALGRSFCSL